MSAVIASMQADLLAALGTTSGLILVTGPTANGKTTAIEEALADPRCPPAVVFIGDLRGGVEDAYRAIRIARSQVVIAELRITRASALARHPGRREASRFRRPYQGREGRKAWS